MAASLDDEALRHVGALFGSLPETSPGVRMDPRPLASMPALGRVHAAAAAMLGSQARPVRALLFDKHDAVNWSLGWHQDRTIEVAERADVPGFGPFTHKQGRLHAAPPIDVIERMLTVRIHVDRVDDQNGVLVVAPGSHRLGYIAQAGIAAVVARCGQESCFAEEGGVWFYSTPILHRSDRANPGRRRRVLQIDYSHDPLPGGLRWVADD